MLSKQHGKYVQRTLVSGFRRYVDEICALLGCYAASCGNLYKTFLGKTEGTRPFGITIQIWTYNIKMEIDWENVH
jgi:hypothetical protein